MGKSRFDQCLYALDAAKFSHYHGDNIIFTAAEYLHDCKQKGQTQSFYGVGAQHHNARFERSIQNVVHMARIFIVHASLHWSDISYDDLSLCSFDVKQSVWIYNQFSIEESGPLLYNC